MLLPTNASELKPGDYFGSEHPTLCLPQEDGDVSARMLTVVDEHIKLARKGRKAGKAYCDATAGLLDEPPADWDAAEDGEWKGEINTAAERFPNASYGCGPLTPALDIATWSSVAVPRGMMWKSS